MRKWFLARSERRLSLSHGCVLRLHEHTASWHLRHTDRRRLRRRRRPNREPIYARYARGGMISGARVLDSFAYRHSRSQN